MKPTTTPYPAILTNYVANLRREFDNLSKIDDLAVVEFLTKVEAKKLKAFGRDFGYFAHDHQRPPERANSGADWTTWLILGGRGAGKTRAGAEWVRDIALDDTTARIALIGETEHEVRAVMVEGVSGLLAVHRARRTAAMAADAAARCNGRTARWREVFSAENFEALRGPQFSAAWCDELAKWRQAEATFDMLQFGLRLGERPRQVVTTTPRPIALIKKLLADPRTAVTHAGTRANAYNLAPAFVETVLARYQDTRLGPPGDRRRDRRGAQRRAVDARRASRAAASRRRRRSRASWWRSIRRPPPKRAPTPAASSPPGAPTTARFM